MPNQPPRPAPQTRPPGGVTGLPLRFLACFHTPWMWLSFSALALVLDYLSGAFIHLSILFIFPVAAASWHRGLRFALPLALLLPCFRLLYYATWDAPWAWIGSGASYVVRTAVLGTVAVMTAHLRRQTNELRLLRGLLPICGYCKKIRDSQGTWHPIETYISSRTEARFSHGICPSCLQKHHGDVMRDSGL